MRKTKIKEVEVLAKTKFLSLYNAKYENKNGKERNWTIASRKGNDVLTKTLIQGKEDKVDAVVIVAFHKRENKLVLVKQFRVPINDYIYELPAGLVDEGEEAIVSLKRELKEETGLDLIEIIPSMGRDKVYLSPGMTDESVNLVYCICDGEISKDGLEDDEDLEPLLISKEEAKAILQSDSKIDIKCLMVLQSFINMNIEI